MVNKSTNISKTNNHFTLELTEENKTKRPLNMNGKLAQNGLGLLCLMVLSTIFHLYRGGQFY